MLQLETAPIETKAAEPIRRKADVAPWAVLIGYYLLSCLLISPIGNFPLNDDWSYTHSVRVLAETGRYVQLADMASCILQTGIAAGLSKVFGFSFTLLRLTTLVFGFIGVTAFYLSLRELKLARWPAVMMSMLVAANPLFLNLCFTFMTDVPALSLANVYFFFMLRAIRKDSPRLFLIAALMLTAALAVRQSLVILIGCNALVVALYAFRKKPIGNISVSLLALPVGFLVFSELVIGHVLQYPETYTWTKARVISVLADFVHNPSHRLFTSVVTAGKISYYLGLFLAPVLVLFLASFGNAVSRFKNASPIPPALAATVVAITNIKLVCFDGALMPFNQNLLRIPMIGPLTIMGIHLKNWSDKTRLWLTGISAFLAFIFICIVGATVRRTAVLAGRTFKRGSSFAWRRLITALFCTSTFIATFGFMIIQAMVRDLDRYYLMLLAPSILCVALCWKWLRVRPRYYVSVPLIALLALYSTAATHDYMSWNRARWTALDRLEDSGVPIAKIDGGYEYNYWNDPTLNRHYSFSGQTIGIQNRGEMPRANWRWWAINGEEFIVSFSTIPDYDVIAREPFFSALSLQEKELYVLKRAVPNLDASNADPN